MSLTENINTIPYEILCRIAIYLPIDTLKNFIIVNKRCSIISKDQIFWRRYLTNYFSSDNYFQDRIKKINSLSIIFYGSVGSGKTSLLLSYKDKNFPINTRCTLSPDLFVLKKCLYNMPINILLYDTNSLMTTLSTQLAYSRTCQSAVFVFDVSDKESFYYVKRIYYKYIAYNNQLGVDYTVRQIKPVFLFGNKDDLQYKKVSDAEINDFCSSENIYYYTISAKNIEGVNKCIDSIIKISLECAIKNYDSGIKFKK